MGLSVNDGIDEKLSSLSYVSVDDIVNTILSLGQGTMRAKIDVRNAYRVIPVHPEDRMLLGMSWKGKVYVDATLPFGLRSAPKIFTAVADACEWILRQRGLYQGAGSYMEGQEVLSSERTPIPGWHSSACMQSSPPRSVICAKGA